MPGRPGAPDGQGQDSGAINAYKNAMERDNRQPHVLVNLAYTYLNQKRLKMARRTLEQAVAIDPSLPTAHEALGYCLFQSKDYDAARKAYLTALALDARMSGAYANLGSIEMLRYLQRRDDAKPELALEYWHRSLELDANQPKLHQLIAKYSKPALDPNTVLLDGGRGK